MLKFDPQTLVALAIVFGLATIGLSLIVAVVVVLCLLGDKGAALITAAVGTLGTVVGALATALNAPTGVLNIISAAKQPPVSQAPPA